MSKKRVVSGITATGKLTIGNYIGAIKNFVKMQDEFEMFIFVADLHALTNDTPAKELSQNRRDILALYLAAGLDPEKVTLFYQSEVSAHGTMAWIMQNQTTIGELSRMTQFKDKSTGSKEANGTYKIKTGLLTYPALMAGDILLYSPDLVPTGKDQKQHIELTKQIAHSFNNRYGETFKMPESYIPKEGSKILSLTDPSKKMSKSSLITKSYISLLDDPQRAHKKIMQSVTDSENKIYVSENKPAITNLLTIYASLATITLDEAAKKFKNATYYDLKIELASEVQSFLTKLQKRYHESLKIIDKIALKGAKRANKISQEKLQEVKQKIGL